MQHDTERVEATRTTVRVRSFPWGAVRTMTRAEVAVIRDVNRWLAERAPLGQLQAALAALLSTDVRVRVRSVGLVKQPHGLGDGAAVALADAEDPRFERAVLVEAEYALVVAALSRGLRNRPPTVMQPMSMSATVWGGFAAIVAAALRRARGGITSRVLTAGPATSLEGDLVRTGHELVSVGLVVLLADDAFEARIVAPRAVLGAPRATPWGAAAMGVLGSTPLRLCVVGCAAVLSITDVASLRRGDVVLLPGWPLGRGPEPLAGDVVLAASGASMGVAAVLKEGKLTLSDRLVPVVNESERSDAMDEGKNALMEAIGEVPVVVRVEIGDVEMSAREWASVGLGEVVTMGRRVGEPVTLRVGNVVVARGDLVDVEGEVGVRILERIG